MKKFLTILAFVVLSPTVWAWEPKQTVQIIVPFPVGGTSDVIARAVVNGLTAQGITNISVINKPGAGGSIGTNLVLDSKADGHTIMLTGTAFLFNQLQQAPGTNYDVVKSFSHIGMIGHVPQNVYTRPGITENMSTVVDNMRSGRKHYSWGTTNPGAESLVRLISKQLGTSLTAIPYKGSPPALTDLIGGHIDFIIDTPASPALQSAVDSGRIRLIVELNSQTESQHSMAHYVPGAVLYSWFGLSLPAGANPEVIKFWNNALNLALQEPITKNQLKKSEVVITTGPPEKFINLITSDFKKFSPVVNKIK